jgi:hypothetical protein
MLLSPASNLTWALCITTSFNIHLIELCCLNHRRATFQKAPGFKKWAEKQSALPEPSIINNPGKLGKLAKPRQLALNMEAD